MLFLVLPSTSFDNPILFVTFSIEIVVGYISIVEGSLGQSKPCWAVSEPDLPCSGTAQHNKPRSPPSPALHEEPCCNPTIPSTRPYTKVCYPVYALYGVGLVMRNRLGVNEDGTIFSFLSWQGFYINGLTILSSTLYFPILESLLAAFPCEYLQTEGANGSMINQTEGANGFSQTMEAALGFGGGACYGRAHLAYMVGAGLALLMYYPLASFVFPNLQVDAHGLW